MTKITKCPIFLDGMNFLIASKSHFLMVLKPNTLCPSLLITLYFDTLDNLATRGLLFEPFMVGFGENNKMN